MVMEISDHGQNDHWCIFELSISTLIILVYRFLNDTHIDHVYSTHCILVIDGGFQEGVDEDESHW
jgi:hypothetical protein